MLLPRLDQRQVIAADFPESERFFLEKRFAFGFPNSVYRPARV
jgi:hypothetical protein